MDSFRIDERVESDHMPLIAKLRIEGTNREEGKKDEFKTIIRWDDEAKQRFKEKIEERTEEEGPEENTIEKKWEKIKETVKAALVKEEKRMRRRKLGYKEWWDRGCTKEKRKVVKAYKNWKNGRLRRENYLEEKKTVNIYMEGKRKKKKEEQEEE